MVEISGAVTGLWVIWGWGGWEGGIPLCPFNHLHGTTTTLFTRQTNLVSNTSLGLGRSSSLRGRKRN